MNTVIVHYANGSENRTPFTTFWAARRYCQRNISYSSGKVRRVEIATEGGGLRAMWDSSWDVASQQAGLEMRP